MSESYDEVSAWELHKRYVGDGVYASFDGYQIWLRTNRCGLWHEVALDPDVMGAVADYAAFLSKTLREAR